jgi:hypothetical protein
MQAGSAVAGQMAGLNGLDQAATARLTSAMIPEIDIWRAASVMIRRYKETADFEAARRADEFGAKGDRAGMRIWLQILAAIDALQHVQAGETMQ